MSNRVVAFLGGRSIVIALIVAFAYFMENLDANIIVTALPQMAQTFGITPTRMGLGVTAYMLAVAACIPASGWLADRIGARNLFCGAIGAFTLASMLCGLAPNFDAFIAARILQGAAAAMMSPVGRLVVLRNAEKKDLLRALSTLVWPALFAPVVGPPLGGLITSAASWRWIFYVNLPIGLLGMALVLAFVPNQKTAESPPFDSRGFVMLAIALACLTYGLDVIGQREAQSLVIGGALLIGAAVMGYISVRHLQSASHPVVQLDALRQRSFFVSSISGGTVSRAAVTAPAFLLPLMFQLAYGLSPVQSGLLLLIYMAANLAMKAITNPILKRWGLRQVVLVNTLVASAGIAACGLISPTAPVLLSGLVLVIAGASRSMQFTAVAMITFADVTPAQRAPAAVVAALSQQVGSSMGVAAGVLMLNFSEFLRHAPRLEVFDFRVAFGLVAIFSALAFFSYAKLDKDVGAEISGHRPKLA